jgi:cell shape-determining protein MreC
MIPVEGHKGLYRDENTNAIINCNENEYQSYMLLKNKKQNDDSEIKSLRREIDELKSLLKTALSNKL